MISIYEAFCELSSFKRDCKFAGSTKNDRYFHLFETPRETTYLASFRSAASPFASSFFFTAIFTLLAATGKARILLSSKIIKIQFACENVKKFFLTTRTTNVGLENRNFLCITAVWFFFFFRHFVEPWTSKSKGSKRRRICSMFNKMAGKKSYSKLVEKKL